MSSESEPISSSSSPEEPNVAGNTQKRLVAFFANNPGASFEDSDGQQKIVRPWGDETVEIRIPNEEADSLLNALNAVVLPQRFTALWHTDSQDLEIIYTAHPIEQPMRSRAFLFRFDEKEYRCAFGPASDRLRLIATNAVPLGPPTHTEHRNLASFNVRHLRTKDEDEDEEIPPTSFWIRELHWDDNAIADIVRHLNFYMRYFDRESPMIMIHDESPESDESAGPDRLPFGDFPNEITGARIDPYLLGLWRHSIGGDPFLSFLHSYQILEYAASYFTKEGVLQTIKKILASPETPGRLDEAVRDIVDAMVEDRASEEHKLVAVMQQLVNPEAIWKELLQNRERFCEETQFEGGCTIPPLLKEGWEFDDFKAAWMPRFPDALRKLRNAFVHSREPRQGTILRTDANYERLRPWLAPTARAAVQVILYRETL